MLIGEKHDRIVVEGDDLLRPYAIRPAVRPDPNPPVWPEWARITTNIAVWIVFPAVFWVLVIHALLPSIR